METIPLCRCHNVLMLWKTDKRKKNGGYWTCHVKLQERWRKYSNSLNGYYKRRKWKLLKERKVLLQKLEELYVE
jgi:hypothetical protein